MSTKTKIEPTFKIPPQELTKYNRESGKKTLLFVAVLITIIVVLTITSLFLMNK